MMQRLSTFAAMLSLAVFAATAQANLLNDGSVEQADNNTDVSNSAWVLTADVPSAPNGGTDLSAIFSESVWAASDGAKGVWFRSFEGNQDPGDTTANASLAQTVPGIAVEGGDYLLTFDSARETNHTAGSTTATLGSGASGSVTVDLLAATYNGGGNMNAPEGPTKFSLRLNNVAPGDTLSVSVDMVDGVDALANPQSIMFDNFVLTTIPEPASLLMAGLGMLGLLAVRRKR